MKNVFPFRCRWDIYLISDTKKSFSFASLLIIFIIMMRFSSHSLFAIFTHISHDHVKKNAKKFNELRQCEDSEWLVGWYFMIIFFIWTVFYLINYSKNNFRRKIEGNIITVILKHRMEFFKSGQCIILKRSLFNRVFT
jgi:uncharacterized membrane protein